MREVLIDLELSLAESLLVRFELLRQISELRHETLVLDVDLPELGLRRSPLPNLDGPRDLRVLPDLCQRPPNNRLLDHLAAEVQVVLARLRRQVLKERLRQV